MEMTSLIRSLRIFGGQIGVPTYIHRSGIFLHYAIGTALCRTHFFIIIYLLLILINVILHKFVGFVLTFSLLL